MESGSSAPARTISSTSTIQIFPAVAASGLKLRAALRNTTLPFSSAFHPLISEKSPVIDLSRMYSLPSPHQTCRLLMPCLPHVPSIMSSHHSACAVPREWRLVTWMVARAVLWGLGLLRITIEQHFCRTSCLTVAEIRHGGTPDHQWIAIV